MKLHIKNTLTQQKEIFVPLKKDEVSMYVCGVTLYDNIHIGHLKSIIAFEVMRNYFKTQGQKVTLVRNITDVDDKIIAKAESNGLNPLDLVNKYVKEFHLLLEKMGIPSPDIEPRVTEYLKKIEVYIQELQNKGYAYKSEDGIYFNTQKNTPIIYPLSKKIVKDLENTSRLTDNDYSKNHKADFALWKKDDKYGYPSSIFKSQGRPGWHIECSVMHHHTLGEQFDIHGGGRDLIFPHHENEILQSVAHNGVNPAKYWIHNGMMTKNGKKLSKSLGNSIYVKDLLDIYSPEAIKMFLNKGQYNQSQEFNNNELEEANNRWDEFVSHIPKYINIYKNEDLSLFDKVTEALEDDFNTPQAISLLYPAMKNLKTTLSKKSAEEILKVMKLLAIVKEDKTLENIYEESELSKINAIPSNIRELAERRREAKDLKDYILSDNIRKDIQKLGWEIKDSEKSYILKRKV